MLYIWNTAITLRSNVKHNYAKSTVRNYYSDSTFSVIPLAFFVYDWRLGGTLENGMNLVKLHILIFSDTTQINERISLNC